jgi:hypothetical protein
MPECRVGDNGEKRAQEKKCNFLVLMLTFSLPLDHAYIYVSVTKSNLSLIRTFF